MHTRTLGALPVSAIGYGAMVLVHGMYGENDDERSLTTLGRAIDAGASLIDTADAYGADHHNEQLIGRAIAGRRGEVQIATKWGISLDGEGRTVEASYANRIVVDGSPGRAGAALDASLAALGTDHVDLWYLHFPDPAVPIEETVGAMADQVAAGKVRFLGVSNVSEEQLRAAHAVHPLAALEYEWSLWTRGIEAALLPAARELGVGVVPWSPLGSGFLAADVSAVGGDDFRANAPRFSAGNLRTNRDRFAPLRALAERLEITPAQLALAWLLAQGDDVVPIPGSRSADHVEQNLAAAGVVLDGDTLDEIERIAPPGAAAGAGLLTT